MQDSKDIIFTRSTVLISIILSIIAGGGILLTPKNAALIIIFSAVVIAIIIFNERFSQIDQHTEEIAELNRRMYKKITRVGRMM